MVCCNQEFIPVIANEEKMGHRRLDVKELMERVRLNTKVTNLSGNSNVLHRDIYWNSVEENRVTVQVKLLWNVT